MDFAMLAQQRRDRIVIAAGPHRTADPLIVMAGAGGQAIDRVGRFAVTVSMVVEVDVDGTPPRQVRRCRASASDARLRQWVCS
jgi:hypothetical protein